MKTSFAALISLAGFLAQAPLQSGCSLIGLAVDASQPADTVCVDPARGGLEGKTVLITMHSGERFAAKCGKVGVLPLELYRERYTQQEKPGGGVRTSPWPGDTVHIAWERGRISAGVLQGFTRGAVVIERPGRPEGFLRHRAQALSIPVGRLDSLWTLRGAVWDRQRLEALLAGGAVPTMDALLVRRGDTAAWVSLDGVSTIAEIHHPFTWFNNGAIADGVGLVAALVYLAARRP